MKLIVGLGNPGRRYEKTRHNVGFKVATALAEGTDIELNTEAFDSFIGRGQILGEEAMIALPQVYMNRSGEAVARIIARKKIKLNDNLVICDDADLPLGVIRIRARGSSAGHKGLNSIIENLETSEFARLRVGIGRRTEGSDLSGYVLSKFDKDEAKALDSAIERAVECCKVWVKDGTERAANIFNATSRKDRI